MLKVFFFLLYSTFYILYSVPLVSAHTLKTDGTIGALFYTDPDDEVFANSQVEGFLEFRDTTHKFSLSNCRCQVSIYQGSTVMFASKLTVNNATYPNNASFLYIFPNAGTYTITVVGSPISKEAFAPFKLSYEVELGAKQEKAEEQPSFVARYVGIGIVAFLGIIGLIYYLRKRSS